MSEQRYKLKPIDPEIENWIKNVSPLPYLAGRKQTIPADANRSPAEPSKVAAASNSPFSPYPGPSIPVPTNVTLPNLRPSTGAASPSRVASTGTAQPKIQIPKQLPLVPSQVSSIKTTLSPARVPATLPALPNVPATLRTASTSSGASGAGRIPARSSNVSTQGPVPTLGQLSTSTSRSGPSTSLSSSSYASGLAQSPTRPTPAPFRSASSSSSSQSSDVTTQLGASASTSASGVPKLTAKDITSRAPAPMPTRITQLGASIPSTRLLAPAQVSMPPIPRGTVTSTSTMQRTSPPRVSQQL